MEPKLALLILIIGSIVGFAKHVDARFGARLRQARVKLVRMHKGEIR